MNETPIKQCVRAIVSTALLAVVVASACAQTRTLHLHIKPNPEFGHDLDSMRLSLSIRQYPADYVNPASTYWWMDADGQVGQRSLRIDSVPVGDSFQVTLHGTTDRHEGRYIISQHFPGLMFVQQPLSTGPQNFALEVEYPPSCSYYLRRHNKVCPACGKADKVLPIVYGLLLDDPLSSDPLPPHLREPYYSGGCGVTGCDPYWHCERDNTNF